jgi:DnaJ-class molecular chaperone
MNPRTMSVQYGEEAAKEGIGAGGSGGMDDIFNLFAGGARKQRGPRKGEDVIHRLQVSLKDFYMGTTKCGPCCC